MDNERFEFHVMKRWDLGAIIDTQDIDKGIIEGNSATCELLNKLQKENERLRAALAEFANPDHWVFYDWWIWCKDKPYETAQAALGGVATDPHEIVLVEYGDKEE